ncbi:hypothetical protein [Vibrio harveyi]|uniref:hypothetical protein n=1 Tax=Vibrio harveyi TaxID=669 RepID=UPI00247FD205|nr:hypothetical protein [Vibrio harveyi]
MIIAFFHETTVDANVVWVKSNQNDFNYSVSDILTDAYCEATRSLVESGNFTVESEYEVCKKIMNNVYKHVHIYDSINALQEALSNNENMGWFDRFYNEWLLHQQSNPDLLNIRADLS